MSHFRLPFHPLFIGCVLLGLVGVLPNQALGAAKPKVPPPEDKRVLVKAVNEAAKQITVERMINGQTQIYTVDDFTQVTVENSPGSIKDIKAGQEVFSYVERDGSTLDSITVGKADPPPVKPKG
jgi:hypothetical protein